MEYTSILRRIFIVFGIALLITAILINLYRVSFNKLNENSDALIHSMKVLESIEELLSLTKDTEVGVRGFVISGDSSFLQPFLNAQEMLPLKINELRLLSKNNKLEGELLDSTVYFINDLMERQLFLIYLKSSDNLKYGFESRFQQSKLTMDRIRTFCHRMKMEESSLRVKRDSEVTSSIELTKVISTIFSIAAITIMIIALVSILIELRSRHKIQEILRSVLEATQNGIMSFKAIRDPSTLGIIDFELIQANKGGANMVGIPAEALIGNRLLTVFPGNYEEGLFSAYVSVTNTGETFKTEKYYKHDNIDKWFRISAVKLYDGFTVTFEDISAEKSYEIQLENSINKLKRSNMELEQFAFVASHDLQEPLRKIQSFGDRLKMYGVNELKGDSLLFIEKMLESAGRMSNLIRDLLDFSRLSQNKDNFELTDLNLVVNEVLNDLEFQIQKKSAEIIVDPLPVIDSISSQMYQLIFNLVGNALKFSKDGVNPVIRIVATTINKTIDTNYFSSKPLNVSVIKIDIIDNGIGFDEKYSARIFEIFQRLHGKSEYSGTGIGLAICKRIVLNHKGTITVKSTPGAGATFTVELPVSAKSIPAEA